MGKVLPTTILAILLNTSVCWGGTSNFAERVIGFLDLLQWTSPVSAAFDVRNAPHWNIDEIEPFIAEKIWIGGGKSLEASRQTKEQLLRSLNEKSLVHHTFAHFSYFYSLPHIRDAGIVFHTIAEDQLEVTIAGRYTLAFKTAPENEPLLYKVLLHRR